MPSNDFIIFSCSSMVKLFFISSFILFIIHSLYKVLSLVGANIAGKVANFPITVSGMLAASHKEGGPMTAKYLKSLEKNKEGMYYLPYHKYKGNTLRSFLAIETRLREFANLNSNN